MTEKSKQLVLKGKCWYAQVHRPNTYQGKTLYKLKLFTTNKELLKKLKESGVKVMMADDEDKYGEMFGKQYIVVKSSAKPAVVDSNKNPIPESVLIGNGSEVNVLADLYKWKSPEDGSTGHSLTLHAVQVVNLVEYKKKDMSDIEKDNIKLADKFDAIKDGYTANDVAALYEENERAVESTSADELNFDDIDY